MCGSLSLQKREEHNSFDAEEFRQWPHRPQFVVICSVEQHQAVHGAELRKIIYERNIWIRNAKLKFALAIHAAQLANDRDDRREWPNYGVLKDAVLAVVNQLTSHPPRRHPAEREEVIDLRFELNGDDEVHLQVEIVQQIFHEVVDHVSLVDLSESVNIQRVLGVN